MACLGPHSEVERRESKRDRARASSEQVWCSAFIGVKGGVPRLLQVHSLLVNLKH